MKTYQGLRLEFLNMAQRKAVGRRMAQVAKKASTQMKKARNKLRPWSKEKLHGKAQKAVRKFVMQKVVGKQKDLSDISLAQKEKLEILTNKAITTVFQPIFNVQSKTILGYEALTRGPEGTELYSPDKLFYFASQYDLISELEILCRDKAITRFAELKLQGKLFLNISLRLSLFIIFF